MKKIKYNKKIFLAIMAMLFTVQASIPAYAMTNNKKVVNKTEKEISLYKILPKYKEYDLDELKRDIDLSKEEENFLKNQYLKTHNQTAIRWKVSAIKKVIKVAKPILKKAAKKFGMKIGEKSIADFTDYLFDWEDNIQGGIESFLVNEWGWNRTAAHWTAKTIMFVAF